MLPVATIDDLPLELVEQVANYLDVKDVLRFMMVNTRLYHGIDRSIAFGNHVAETTQGAHLSEIKKLVGSPCINLKLEANLLPFTKRVVSSDRLVFHAKAGDGILLNQLKYVNQLWFYAYKEEDCKKSLADFYGFVKNHATILIRFNPSKGDQALKEQLSHFFENQLGECERVVLKCNFKDCLQFYQKALMKTRIKMISIQPTWDKTLFGEIISYIVSQGIPSKHPEAVMHIVTDFDNLTGARIGDLLSQSQGVQKVIDGKNHWALVSRANQLIREKRKGLGSRMFTKRATCSYRQINPTTSSIYVFEEFGVFRGVRAQFLTFHTPRSA